MFNKNFSYYNLDLPCFYQFNSNFKNIDNCDSILLVGVNPRYEASMLNTRIRKRYNQKNIPIGLIGSPVNLTYPISHLGSSTKTLIELAE
jgi:NADH-quinone oxidoreductase subunit G